ncbi:TusE/DsrC/DsvC family sulfur relay protein [Brachybacterium sp. EF45031]|uniref:TusE/DsrC/DsvC family sulfur relay protein n=1 Tax=Brachybacterium sillae TaxID=2810536 RepID=UPI00217E7E85|nr:TusE/DsrC/DsvC family sulfur relay protein [Brachybacterium sillae]MCS6711924.1 TusE/DsrC/DsvC family sulfur relay protein [Brachybacterium sillae]
MPTNTFLGRPITVNEEGFLTVPEEWDEELAAELARIAGFPELSDAQWELIRFVRQDYLAEGAAPTMRRMNKVGGFDIKAIFEMFPGKPAKILAYIAGATKPVACV